MSLSKNDIKLAMKKYDQGHRPFKFKKPRSWYVYGINSKNLYPLKYIYALATNIEPSKFNTSTSISELKKLGFNLFHEETLDEIKKFEERINESLDTSSEIRKQRLSKANKTPSQYKVEIVVFNRNPDVVAEVLLRAKGICESCNLVAPFIREKDGMPYLEVHHKIRLADGGEDTVENAVAICPNCHRKAHYGKKE
ncbi:HNH endonuclease [Acinetobacter venetianus]|uniref:HNH endonuclease n=1 Tax=Acinetobacter venetianus TaxID=52133 RepID=A0A150HVK0_9GAMM|nr:HNH endonuclease [Acinetobacter venetianus]KXZ71096.1 HNH endonuclease [Acinetobacter venetianus]